MGCTGSRSAVSGQQQIDPSDNPKGHPTASSKLPRTSLESDQTKATEQSTCAEQSEGTEQPNRTAQPQSTGKNHGPEQREKSQTITDLPSESTEENQTSNASVKPDMSSLSSGSPESKTSTSPIMSNSANDKSKTSHNAASKPSASKESKTKSSSQSSETVDNTLPLEPEAQRKFDTVLQKACSLVKPQCVMKAAGKSVTRLQLHEALPPTYSLFSLVTKLTNLQVLDLSKNNLGPQGFRSVCLALCYNSSIISLNLADNKSDTDSAECVGQMLMKNEALVYLDISNNYLGKDYFSRCVGPVLKSNTSLRTLRAQNIGSTDMKVMLESLSNNSTLQEVDLSSNGLSDRSSLGRGFAAWIKQPGCQLSTLSLGNCNMDRTGLSHLCDALKENLSLVEMNLNGNEFGSQGLICKFILIACCQRRVQNLHMNDAKVKDTDITITDFPELPNRPALEVLSLNTSNINNHLFSTLKKWAKGRQLPIRDLDISNNSSMSPEALVDILSITLGEGGTSSLQRLSFGLNSADSMSQELKMSSFPFLSYINLRKAKINTVNLVDMCKTCLSPDSAVTTLVLDGLKIAGTNVLVQLSTKTVRSKLTTLSFGGCSLADDDLLPLCDFLKQGHGLHMLKLSANRITDSGVSTLVEALISQQTHPLGVLDLANNAIGDGGASSLLTLWRTKSHKSCLHSLNVSGNTIGKAGVVALVSALGNQSVLRRLYLNGQGKAIDEVEMDEVYSCLATTLGFAIANVQPNTSDLPTLPEGLLVNLKNLGGQPGSLGRLLHSSDIVTDMTQDVLTGLTLSGVLEIVAALTGTGKARCMLSSRDWGLITGSHKDREVPSWLQLSDHRARAVYMCNLPGNASVQKLEGMLEMEVDCSVDEVVLMKDPVTRSNSGVAWALLSDEASVEKAVDFYHQGEAKIFGQPFSISRICVDIDDKQTSELEARAREDLQARQKARRVEDAAHRALIQQNTEESWKRHAYRLAHPAYADGRIW